MRRFNSIFIGSIFTTFLLILSIGLHAASMGVSQGHDLDELWARAREQFDISRHDAVLLLESRQVSILDNGDLRTRVHRAVWISTDAGMDAHADLRIPWNSVMSTLNIIALRTWMDNKWWPDESKVSETAVVETLPFALALADDYTAMRETMLLHDGVELPCIMETIYEIEERGAASEGSDGLWVFSQTEPAVLVEYTLGVPSGVTPAFRSGNGAPEPETNGGSDQRTTYIWRMENVGRLGSPRISNPAVYAPHVTWSTWKDWETLGKKITSSFDEAAVLSDALTDSLSAHIKHEPSNAAKARAVASFVNECTRSIHYDSGFWRFSPRPATRTWETAYGHGLDRAVLAAVLFREAGFNAEPIFRSAPQAANGLDLPALSHFGEIAVLVEGLRLNAVFDPVEGSLGHANSWVYGKVVWRPDLEKGLRFPGEGHDNPEFWSRSVLVLTLEPGDEGGFGGTGFLSADGIFCPYDEMTGLEGEALSYLNGIVQSVLPGAEVQGYNPEAFGSFHVTTGFEFTLKALQPDVYGRTCIIAGMPAAGITSNLPSDVHPYDEQRSSPVLLSGKMLQNIELRVKTGDREVVYIPETRTLENDAGRFTLTVENKDGWVTIERELSLNKTIVQPEEWRWLRALLLEESDAANRTILMK